jgi:GrpB-like predicted nucleotidyltransferase (UPF0157 family)
VSTDPERAARGEPSGGRILPYPNPAPPPALRDHDPRAFDVARVIIDLITARMPSALVEHIGSTSVAGCAGKGYVDLMLAYPDGELDAAKGALADLGFQRQFTRDPFPEERPLRIGALDHDGERFLLHVHVISERSPEVDEMRAFRERLRARPALRDAYVACKRAILDEGVTDGVDYAIKKGGFVQSALAMITRPPPWRA